MSAVASSSLSVYSEDPSAAEAISPPAPVSEPPRTFFQRLVLYEKALDARGCPVLFKHTLRAAEAFVARRAASHPSSVELSITLLPHFSQVFAPAFNLSPFLHNYPLDCDVPHHMRLPTASCLHFSVSVLNFLSTKGPFMGSVTEERLWSPCGGRAPCGQAGPPASSKRAAGNHPVPLRFTAAQKDAVSDHRRNRTDVMFEGTHAIVVRVSFFESDSESSPALLHRHMLYTASKLQPKNPRDKTEEKEVKPLTKKKRGRGGSISITPAVGSNPSSRDKPFCFSDQFEHVAQLVESDPTQFGEEKLVAAFVRHLRWLGSQESRPTAAAPGHVGLLAVPERSPSPATPDPAPLRQSNSFPPVQQNPATPHFHGHVGNSTPLSSSPIPYNPSGGFTPSPTAPHRFPFLPTPVHGAADGQRGLSTAIHATSDSLHLGPAPSYPPHRLSLPLPSPHGESCMHAQSGPAQLGSHKRRSGSFPYASEHDAHAYSGGRQPMVPEESDVDTDPLNSDWLDDGTFRHPPPPQYFPLDGGVRSRNSSIFSQSTASSDPALPASASEYALAGWRPTHGHTHNDSNQFSSFSSLSSSHLAINPEAFEQRDPRDLLARADSAPDLRLIGTDIPPLQGYRSQSDGQQEVAGALLDFVRVPDGTGPGDSSLT